VPGDGAGAPSTANLFGADRVGKARRLVVREGGSCFSAGGLAAMEGGGDGEAVMEEVCSRKARMLSARVEDGVECAA
jgi:hypothetical protein